MKRFMISLQISFLITELNVKEFLRYRYVDWEIFVLEHFLTRTTLYSFLRAIGRNTCGASLFDKSIDKQLVPDSRLGSYYSSYRAKFIHSRINRPSSSFPRSFGIIQDWKSIIQSYEIFLMDYDLSYPFVKDTSGNSFARLHYALHQYSPIIEFNSSQKNIFPSLLLSSSLRLIHHHFVRRIRISLLATRGFIAPRGRLL